MVVYINLGVHVLGALVIEVLLFRVCIPAPDFRETVISQPNSPYDCQRIHIHIHIQIHIHMHIHKHIHKHIHMHAYT